MEDFIVLGVMEIGQDKWSTALIAKFVFKDWITIVASFLNVSLAAKNLPSMPF